MFALASLAARTAWAEPIPGERRTAPSEPRGPAQPLGAGGERTVEFPFFAGGEGVAFFEEAARTYEREHPGVRIEAEGDPRIADKLRVRLLSGSAPELTNAELSWYRLADAGKLLSLDGALAGPSWDGPGTWAESFLPGSLDRYRTGGKTWGVPLFYSVYAVWYNRTLFEQHGWKPPATWSAFFQLAAQMKQAGVAPLAFQGRYHDYADGIVDSAYYHLAGRERFYAQKALEPGSFDNAEYRRALALVQRLAREAFQPGAMGMSHTEAQLEFFEGRAAMIVCGAWLKSEMAGKIPTGFRLGTFNFPLPDGPVAGGPPLGDPTALQVWANYYFVFAGAPHTREAIDFLRFLTSRRMTGRFAKLQDFPVAVRGANEGNLSSDMDDLLGLIGRSRTAYGEAPREGYPELEQDRSDVRYGLLTGALTPEVAATRLEAAAGIARGRREHPDRITVRHVGKPIVLALALLAAGVLAGRSLARRRSLRSPEERLPLSFLGVLAFLGPAALVYGAFVLVPSVRAFAWSRTAWDGLGPMRPVGWLHFKRLLLESDAFWTALGNNLFLMAVVPLVVLPLALFLAACISRGVRGASFFRVVFFFPNLLGTVAATLLFLQLLHPQRGPVNVALAALGFSGFRNFTWLSPDHLYAALVPLFVWSATGFHMVLLLAAMEAIPQSLYEAAALDGASPARQFFQITLPLIGDALTVSVVFLGLGGMKAFEVIWLLTNQQPTTESHVVATRMVQAMFGEMNIGEATAIAVLLFLMVFAGTAATIRLFEKAP